MEVGRGEEGDDEVLLMMMMMGREQGQGWRWIGGRECHYVMNAPDLNWADGSSRMTE
jgi:hypothetical protein